MSEILCKFEMCSKIDTSLKRTIKRFHVFDEQKEVNILFVTTNDKVYGFGTNLRGVCGVGHDIPVTEPQLIIELCDMNIKYFYNGINFVLALTSDNKLFGWGRNSSGQMATDVDDRIHRPQQIEFIESIKDVVCGSAHILVLTKESKVYAWGDNLHGQVGCGLDMGESVTEVVQLKTLSNIQSLYSNYCKSFAITENGLVYSWGRNSYCVLGHDMEINDCIFEPRLIANLINIVSICNSVHCIYFKTVQGTIYYCGTSYDENVRNIIQKIPKLLDIDIKLKSLHSIPYHQIGYPIGVAFNGSYVYELGVSEVIKTDCKTTLDFFSSKYKMSCFTIEIEQEQNEIEAGISRLFISSSSESFVSQNVDNEDAGYSTRSNSLTTDDSKFSNGSYNKHFPSINLNNYEPYLFSEIYIERKDIEILHKIGDGEFGEVYFGYFKFSDDFKLQVALKLNKISKRN